MLREIGVQPIQTDQQLFVKHDCNKKLVLAISVHVDDLKVTGLPDEIVQARKILENHFDELKTEENTFEHLGLRHTHHDDGSRSISQEHYVKELRTIPDANLQHQLDEPVDDNVSKLFMSLLGGVAWTVQTRLDIAVFVAALQRKLKSPTGRDVVNLNRVVRYLQRNPMFLKYAKVDNPWRLVAISDSSYKSNDGDCLAMRSGVICLTNKPGLVVGENQVQLLDFVSKKQSRVCRSTYAAEMYSALDLVLQ